MARKKANYPLVEGLEIVDIAAEGKDYLSFYYVTATSYEIEQ